MKKPSCVSATTRPATMNVRRSRAVIPPVIGTAISSTGSPSRALGTTISGPVLPLSGIGGSVLVIGQIARLGSIGPFDPGMAIHGHFPEAIREIADDHVRLC